MKTGQKISLMYSTITILIVIMVGGIFFFYSSTYAINLYYKYLEEKAHIIAVEKFDKDELDPVRYQNVQRRRRSSIPTSREAFISAKDSAKANAQLRKFMSDKEIKELRKNEVVDFRNGKEYGAAIVYNDNTGVYAVVATSTNPYSEELWNTMFWAVLWVIVIAIVILVIISRIYAIRVVDRIDEDYQTEKMFVNNASHEINNPLTAIQGECDIALMKDRDAAYYRNSLQRIDKETDRIIRIMANLLTFSHVRANEINPGDLDYVKISIALEQFRDEDTKITINHDFIVRGRPDLLGIALRNIISNARKYSNDGKAIVVADRNTVTVSNKGIGISKNDIRHIFEPFYRGENVAGVSGNGIGLSLAKAIFERAGVKVSVSSTDDGLTTFTMKFPKVH